jgi:two-component system, LytTR family, response regulator
MKKRLRTIIVDDERLARKDLKSLLDENPDIEIIGEADNVENAIKVINEKDPDLIFLDIQMPGQSGFDLLEEIDIKAKIIFVTAFDEYALKAFEVDAVDYLLKPVNPERLRTAIERVEKEGQTAPVIKRKMLYDDMMFLYINNHMKFLKVKSILCIQSAGDYSEVVTSSGQKGLVQKSMAEWEERLPENYFIRIHRSTIINMEHVTKVEEWFNNSFHVYLANIDTPFVISRRYASKIKERLG